jgi:4-hydroxy-L-threonine phosphate dehydrogenase PdxA
MGESGQLGREEIDVISPVVETLRDDGFDLKAHYPTRCSP